MMLRAYYRDVLLSHNLLPGSHSIAGDPDPLKAKGHKWHLPNFTVLQKLNTLPPRTRIFAYLATVYVKYFPNHDKKIKS